MHAENCEGALMASIATEIIEIFRKKTRNINRWKGFGLFFLSMSEFPDLTTTADPRESGYGNSESVEFGRTRVTVQDENDDEEEDDDDDRHHHWQKAVPERGPRRKTFYISPLPFRLRKQ